VRIAVAIAWRSSLSASGKPDITIIGTFAVSRSDYQLREQHGPRLVRETEIEQDSGWLFLAHQGRDTEGGISNLNLVARGHEHLTEQRAEVLIVFNDQDALSAHCFLHAETRLPRAPGTRRSPYAGLFDAETTFGCAQVGVGWRIDAQKDAQVEKLPRPTAN